VNRVHLGYGSDEVVVITHALSMFDTVEQFVKPGFEKPPV
jgi:hypothetical protein